jgi:hypothetical protein
VDVYQPDKFKAIQERHAVVGNHRIEMSFVQLIHGGATIAGGDHRISRMIQQCPQKKSRMMVIIDNEDSFAIAIHRGLPNQ